jgi:hypothetical protein
MVLRLDTRHSPLDTSAKAPCASRTGQTLIIMVMVMAFSLILGLAISSRVITGLRQVSYSAQSTQALALAEAGAEDGLKLLKDNPGLSLPHSSGEVRLGEDSPDYFSYTISDLGSTTLFDDFSPIARDETVQLNVSGPVYVYWVNWEDSDETADPKALVANLIYDDGGIKTCRYAWDPTVRRATNKFASPEPGGPWEKGGSWYSYRTPVIPLSGTPVLLRVRALYGSIPNSLAVESLWGSLPSQGVKIESTGYVGEVQRKVEVTRSDSMLPGMFDFVLFSASESESLPEWPAP